MLDTRRLRLLHELALRGTLAAVADALAYSPSTVSQQLAQLEREAGVPLIEPDGRRVRLTPHGRVLAEHAARMLELDERAREDLASLRTGLAPVRLAVMQTAALSLVPPALTMLRTRRPDLRVELAELPPEEGLFELQARAFDLVIAEQYAGHQRERKPGIVHELLGEDPIRLVVPAGDEAREISDLRDRVWVMEPAGTAARAWALQQCRAAGFEPDVRFEVADLVSHIRLIGAGLAVGMLPDLVWSAVDPAVGEPLGSPAVVQLSALPGSPVREIFTAVRESSRASDAVRLVREALGDALEAHGRRVRERVREG